MAVREDPNLITSGASARVPASAVVIGAGPYGLAAASHLAGKNVKVRCFGWPMSGWEDHMPRGMYLKSTAPATSIGTPHMGYTLSDYCDQVGIERFDKGGGEVPIPLADFVAYGHWFQERLVPDVERTNVVHVAPRGEGYEVRLETGERLETAAVVVASGLASFAYTPPELRNLSRGSPPEQGHLSHSSEHKDLARLAGSRIAVIGAGQSALETSVLLHESGATVELIARKPKIIWNSPPLGRPPTFVYNLRRPPSPLGASWGFFLVTRFAGQFRYLPDSTRLHIVASWLGPAGGWWLRERFSNAISQHLSTRVLDVSENGGEVVLHVADTTGNRKQIVVDHVIAATGYRVDLSKLEFLDESVRAGLATISGFPCLSTTMESSKRGLYFVGFTAAATFGPLMRFVAGSDAAARRVAHGVAIRAGIDSRG